MASRKHIIFDKIYAFFSRRIVYHTVLWLLYIVSFTIMQGRLSGDYWFEFTNEIVKVIFYGLGVYFNLLYLIPNYLSQKKFLTYCGLLVITAIVITPLQVIALYFKAFDLPMYQSYLLDNMTWFFIVSFLFISLTTVMKIIADWVRHQRDRKELETQTMQSELRFLKSQINPHFLFNTLNNLYALTLKKSDKAPEIVLKLSEMMRYMLYECNEKWVPLAKEVNYIRNYLDLERLRQGKQVNITFEIDGNVSNQKIAPLLFIPFLENCFKHGLTHNIADGYVHIRMLVQEDEVDLYIENSKPKIPNQFHRRSGGIGLVNVRRRLNILYPNKHELNVENAPNSYAIHLHVALDD